MTFLGLRFSRICQLLSKNSVFGSEFWGALRPKSCPTQSQIIRGSKSGIWLDEGGGGYPGTVLRKNFGGMPYDSEPKTPKTYFASNFSKIPNYGGHTPCRPLTPSLGLPFIPPEFGSPDDGTEVRGNQPKAVHPPISNLSS